MKNLHCIFSKIYQLIERKLQFWEFLGTFSALSFILYNKVEIVLDVIYYLLPFFCILVGGKAFLVLAF